MIHTNKKSLGHISISGILTPCEWDLQGNPIELKLCTPGEIDYVLLPGNDIKKMSKYVRQTVSIIGVLTTVDGNEFVKVKSFKPIKQGEYNE
ncbi:MAG: hypothetical protein KDD61_17030 [Bdellovibrionales bacterium]|nr:hypothetical protein [Bdellovibrionales bacterium]